MSRRYKKKRTLNELLGDKYLTTSHPICKHLHDKYDMQGYNMWEHLILTTCETELIDIQEILSMYEEFPESRHMLIHILTWLEKEGHMKLVRIGKRPYGEIVELVKYKHLINSFRHFLGVNAEPILN